MVDQGLNHGLANQRRVTHQESNTVREVGLQMTCLSDRRLARVFWENSHVRLPNAANNEKRQLGRGSVVLEHVATGVGSWRGFLDGPRYPSGCQVQLLHRIFGLWSSVSIMDTQASMLTTLWRIWDGSSAYMEGQYRQSLLDTRIGKCNTQIALFLLQHSTHHIFYCSKYSHSITRFCFL